MFYFLLTQESVSLIQFTVNAVTVAFWMKEGLTTLRGDLMWYDVSALVGVKIVTVKSCIKTLRLQTSPKSPSQMKLSSDKGGIGVGHTG